MKFIIKDINNPKSEIPDKKVSNIMMSAAVSILILLIFFYDLGFGGFMLDVFLETNGTAFFATPLISILILILIIANCILDILRCLFMNLEKDFSFINPNILAISLAALLIANIIAYIILEKYIDWFNTIFTLALIALVLYQIYKDNKSQKELENK